MPIYPDEIAFQIQSGRYIQDDGFVYGLYNLCGSNVKVVPSFFVAPAWILSWFTLNLTLVEIRYAPFFIVISILFLIIWYVGPEKRLPFAIVALTGLAGVAGSGLVLARPEFLQELNILLCLMSYILLKSPELKNNSKNFISVFLILSALLSLFSHPQGLLYVPLTLYFFYRLQRINFSKNMLIFFSLIFLSCSIYNYLTFFHPSCDGFPEIEKFWSGMAFHLNDLLNENFIKWIFHKFKSYIKGFLYVESYAINYLPGIDIKSVAGMFFIRCLNVSLAIILIVNIIAPVILICVLMYTSFVTCKKNVKLFLLSDITINEYLPSILLVFPTILLFLYDSTHNFYRSFFINFVLAIYLLMLITHKKININKYYFELKQYLLLCLIVMLVCFVLNLNLFIKKFKLGYEGPSISLNEDFSSINKDVKELAQTCSMDLNNGRILVDDLTYDSLKVYSHLYPATYFKLTSELARLPINRVVAITKPNYAIARCSLLMHSGLRFSHQVNNLCCISFEKVGNVQ